MNLLIEKKFTSEDNCESLGAKIENKRAGTFGIMSSHSFFFTPYFNNGRRMISTNDEEVI